MKNYIISVLRAIKAKSAWNRAVIIDALSLLDVFNDAEITAAYNAGGLEKLLLNGASDWAQFSYGGQALVYDGDIARHYCTPSELKIMRCGDRRPNRRETWLDVQARGLYQAYLLISQAARGYEGPQA